MTYNKIIVWLPSPMGDAILCTPALKALRAGFPQSRISFYANPVVKAVLSPSHLCDEWIEYKTKNPVLIARQLRAAKADAVILFKNSFLSALSCFLARIPQRIGYDRDFRGRFLTQSIVPQKQADGKYKPVSMVDYYLHLVALTGAAINSRQPQLEVDAHAIQDVKLKLPQIFISRDPIVIFVPGGAFGPSKCWPAEYYAQLADRIIEKYNASVILSVAPNAFELHIADNIAKASRHKLINLAQTPLTLAQLKALFSRANLVVCNDTGPRHIAIALKRKVISLFGPNDPAWTTTGVEGEIQIAATVDCAPCAQPRCRLPELKCMRSISVESVFAAVEQQFAPGGDQNK